MKKKIIDKTFLKKFKYLSITLENSDNYKIDVTDILDIYCEATLIAKKENEYRTDDGFIKISVRAKDTLESSLLQSKIERQEMDREVAPCLKERLEMCDGGADICSFSLFDEQRKKTHIYVPYNPLEEVLYREEIELSNCPSMETDEEGNMIIAFGKSSKQPQRKDNNFSELIEGWTEAFGEYSPSVLKVNAWQFHSFGDNQTNLFLYFDIKNKDYKKESAKFVFINCIHIRAEMFFPIKGDIDIVMSKMRDGRIYVGLDGLGIDFICSSVFEYQFYCDNFKNEQE